MSTQPKRSTASSSRSHESHANNMALSILKYYDVRRYHDAELAKSRRRMMIIGAIVAVLLLIVVGVTTMGIFVSNINRKLGEKVTNELRDSLVQTQTGDPFYLLLLGVDRDEGRVEDTENYGADDGAYRSDSIMLCRVDPKNVKVTMVSIHRDTLVNMDVHGQQKINAAYSFGGGAYATRIVSTFAGVSISHYAEVDLDRFIKIVDQVGGVTVNLPVPVYDPEYTTLDLPAGEQTLNGYEAALLCRCRHGYDKYGDGDVFRAANQRMVFSEVIKKVMSSDPATIASTVSTMAESVTTDMDVSTILDLAMQMKDIDVETDVMTGMEPTEGAFINDTWYEICSVNEWRSMMMRVDQGLSPYDETTGQHDATQGIAGSVGAATGTTESASTTGRKDGTTTSTTETSSDSSSDDAYYGGYGTDED